MLILAECEAYLLTRSAHVGAAAVAVAAVAVAVAVACCRRVRAEVHQIKPIRADALTTTTIMKTARRLFRSNCFVFNSFRFLFRFLILFQFVSDLFSIIVNTLTQLRIS